MDLLEMLMGSGQTRREYEDFVNRYQQGPPSEGYTDQEVMDRYGQVAHKVSPGEYEAAARDAFARLSPEERADFARYLQERAQKKRVSLPAPPPEQTGGLGDLGWLSSTTRQLHEQPGLLRDLLGGLGGGTPSSGAGGLLASPLAKAALAGIAAMVVKRALTPR